MIDPLPIKRRSVLAPSLHRRPQIPPSTLPNPELRPQAKRRRFSAQYKLKILAEVDAAAGSGAIGALLRREGLYSSTLTNWRKERDAAIVQGLSPRTHSPKPQLDSTSKELQATAPRQ